MKTSIMIVIATLLFATLALAETVAIGPFGVRETAVKGEIRVQLDQLVQQIATQQKIAGQEGKVKFTVVGSADKTGLEADNDSYSKDRAMSVKGYLEASLPNVEVVVVPAGSELNARIAQVSYQFVPVTMTESSNVLLVAGLIIAFATVLVGFLFTRGHSRQPVQIVEKDYGPPVEFNAGGLRYRVVPEMTTDAKFVSLRPVIDTEGHTIFASFEGLNSFKDNTQSYFKWLHKNEPKEMKRLVDGKIIQIQGPALEGRNHETLINGNSVVTAAPVPANGN